MIRIGGVYGIIALLLGIVFVLWQADHFARTTTTSGFVHEAALGILFLAACAAYYIVGKIYCANWVALSPQSVLRAIVERAVVPIVTIVLLVRVSPADALPGGFGLSVLGLLMLCLMDLSGSLRKAVEHFVTEMDRVNQRICYVRFPPRTRSDMTPLDLLFFLLTAGLLFKRFT